MIITQDTAGPVLTKDETADTEKPVHGIQTPFNDLLQVGRHLSYKEVERPVSSSG